MITWQAALLRDEASSARAPISTKQSFNLTYRKVEHSSGLMLFDAFVYQSLHKLSASELFVAHRNNIAHISAPSPDLKLELQYHERGHFYFGERGHYYFGLTQPNTCLTDRVAEVRLRASWIKSCKFDGLM